MKTLECFTSKSCGPCRTMKRDLAAWQRPADVDFRLVSIDEEEGARLAACRGAVGLPTVVLLIDGVPTAAVTGWIPGNPAEVLADLEKLAADPTERAAFDGMLIEAAGEVEARERSAAKQKRSRK